MDEFMKKLTAYIYANPPDFGDGDAEVDPGNDSLVLRRVQSIPYQK